MSFTINSFHGVGRVTKDPDVRYLEGSGTTCARFSLALDRGKDKEGNDLGADFPSCVAFGKTAEYIEKYIKKGSLVALEGHIKTGSYEKDGVRRYTTDVIVDKMQNFTPKDAAGSGKSADDVPEGFERVNDDDIPF